jgi:hypothetical protein
MSSKVLDYMNWLKFDLLKDLCPNTPPTGYPKRNPTQYSVYSCSLPIFTELYEVWYVKKNNKVIKKVPPLTFFFEKTF